jgi:hypothetical protein
VEEQEGEDALEDMIDAQNAKASSAKAEVFFKKKRYLILFLKKKQI